jgi:hypothetical protein
MLDFTQVTAQIRSFTTEQARALPQRQAACRESERRLRASGPTWEKTRAKVEESRTSWLVAQWLEPPDNRYAAPPCPAPCIVLAADGSQIVSDRHDIARCCLLNVGLITLRYGTGERATLTSRPTLALSEDLLRDEFPLQEEPETLLPRRLATHRLLAEFAGLAGMIAESGAVPTLALFDGSLILWPLETETPSFREDALTIFQTHQETARQHGVPMVGYVSDPRSRDVINSLRVFACTHPSANCDLYCPGRSRPGPEYVPPPCAGTERVTDADLFAQVLKPGERSAVFRAHSPKILRSYQEEFRVCFFYLHTGREVARVEIPNWVASDAEALRRTHALCCDQARKGDGYPVALAEAHEQAVIRSPEREAFFHLMEQRFVEIGFEVAVTQKAVSKRARRV